MSTMFANLFTATTFLAFVPFWIKVDGTMVILTFEKKNFLELLV